MVNTGSEMRECKIHVKNNCRIFFTKRAALLSPNNQANDRPQTSRKPQFLNNLTAPGPQNARRITAKGGLVFGC